MKDLGKMLIVIGACIAVAGLILWLGADKLKWFGRLPGDIRVRKPGFSLFVPITSMILVSVVISLLLWIVRKYL